jgi:hypothetical protein
LHAELIMADEVWQYWPQVRRLVKRACRVCGDYTAGQLRDRCAHDPQWALVMLQGGCAVIHVDPDNDALHVAVLAGDGLPAGWHMWLCQWLRHVAQDMGLQWVTLRGRKGWQRKLKALGWESFETDCMRVRA